MNWSFLFWLSTCTDHRTPQHHKTSVQFLCLLWWCGLIGLGDVGIVQAGHQNIFIHEFLSSAFLVPPCPFTFLNLQKWLATSKIRYNMMGKRGRLPKLHFICTVRVGWGGVGGCNNVLLQKHPDMMLRYDSSLALADSDDAMLTTLLLYLLSQMMLRQQLFSCNYLLSQMMLR